MAEQSSLSTAKSDIRPAIIVSLTGIRRLKSFTCFGND